MIGHIGCGYWGKNIANSLFRSKLLAAVYDYDPAIHKEYCSKFNLSETSLEDILKNKDITGCSVATPAKTHFEISLKVLEAGKNLFVEKPICLSLEEAYILKEVAIRNDLIIMVGHLLHYHPGFMQLKKMIASKDLGDVKRIKSYRKSFGILRHDEDVVWSFAPHDISMALSITNGTKIENLIVSRKRFFNKNTDAANISFIQNNVNVEIDLDWASSYKQQLFEVYCENGIIILDDTAVPEKKLFVFKIPFTQEQLRIKNSLEPEYIKYDNSQLPLDNELLEFSKLINTKNYNFYNNVDEAINVLGVLKEVEANG